MQITWAGDFGHILRRLSSATLICFEVKIMCETGCKHGGEIGIDTWTHPGAILVATNLNDLDRLMPFAFEMAGECGARLILFHVLPSGASLTVDVAGMPYYDRSGAFEYAEKVLEGWCERARDQGLRCDALVREGNAAQKIIAAVDQFQADRLLLATRSRSKLGKLFLGSVAEQVLRSVKLPVITVGPEAHLPLDGSNREQPVLHATTLGETSRANAALACRLAATQRSKLILVHVLPASTEMERKGLRGELDSLVLNELRALAEETGAACATTVEAKVLHGNPAIEILAEAAESHARLIVLGAVRHTMFDNLTRDRTVHRVLAHARCPVLTLREPIEKAEHVDAESIATQV
jgi:nucleotide-binding universal stress UspA family protein